MTSIPFDSTRDRISHGSTASVANNEAIAPIRTAQDYTESDEDDDDTAALEYAGPATTRSHRKTPSTSQLLGTGSAEGSSSLTDHPARARQASLRADYNAELNNQTPRRLGTLHAARAFLHRNQGFLLIAAAQSFFASIGVCVKILQADISVPVWEIILIRMAVTWLGCYQYMRWTNVEHPLLGPPDVRILLAARGFVGFFGLAPGYYALKYLSLSDATVLTFLSPVLVGALAYLFLAEPFTKTEALTGLTSLLGVVLIAKPTFLFPPAVADPSKGDVTPEERGRAVGIALLGTFGAAGAYLLIRKIGKRANALNSISYFAAWSCIVSIIFPFIVKAPPVFHLNLRFFALILPIGIFGFFAQALLTLGLQREKAGRGTLAVYTNLLFAMILERIVFKRYPDLWSLLGASIIVGGAVKVALEKSKTSPAQEVGSKAADKEADEDGGRQLLLSRRLSVEDDDDDDDEEPGHDHEVVVTR